VFCEVPEPEPFDAERPVNGDQPIHDRRRMPPALVTGIFGMNTKGLPFTDLDTAYLWAALLMVLSSFAACLIMKRIGIIR
jgi:CorA-like Mg2+ transporter protein